MIYDDYCKAVISDAEDVIAENFDDGSYDAETDFADVYDNLFVDDAVTGNASGSYTFNAYQAKENVKDAMFDDYILAALENMGVSKENIASYIFNQEYETLDVCIRCAILSEVYGDIEAYFNDCQSNCEEQDFMDKNSSYWLTAIYVVACACYIGIFYPATNPAVALFTSFIGTCILTVLVYILNK